MLLAIVNLLAKTTCENKVLKDFTPLPLSILSLFLTPSLALSLLLPHSYLYLPQPELSLYLSLLIYLSINHLSN